MPDGVLITRPEPGASATASAVEARGFRSFPIPFLRIEPVATTLPLRAQAILVTSGNALAAPLPKFNATPVFAVGDATAARARALGFPRVESAGGDARALADLVAARCAPASGPLLLLTGEGFGAALEADLSARGFSVLRRAVYASRPVTCFPPPAAQALRSGTLRAALFFSAATARAFAHALPADLHQALGGIDALAIAPATGEALAALPWRQVRAALHPTQDELLALL